MSIGQPERATQKRIIELCRQGLGYRFLGDWTDRASALVFKQPSRFVFRNFGAMRVPKIRAGWAAAGPGLRLSDSFAPFDQTRLEMMWGADYPVTSGETPGETPGKTPERILEVVRANPAASFPELAEAIGKSESAIERAVRKLRKEGRLRRVGPHRGGHWEIVE